MKQNLAWALVVIAASLIYLGDLVVAFGTFFMTARETNFSNELIFITILVGEPIAFAFSISRPKVGGMLLAGITLFTALVALFTYLDGSGPHRILEVMWFGFAFWGPKLLLSIYFFWRSSIDSWRLAAD